MPPRKKCAQERAYRCRSQRPGRHQQPPRRRAAAHALLPTGAGRRADMRAHQALAPHVEVHHRPALSVRQCGGTKEVEEFVDHLLRLRIRGGTPLDTCQFYLDDYEFDISRIILWIRVALQCKVRVLQFICENIDYQDISPRDGHPLFISQYLKKLKLQGLDVVPSRFLDFSFCPNLEDLEIVECFIADSVLISSESLKRLTIHGYFYQSCRLPISICAPNLVSLWLQVGDGRTPSLSLQMIPSLVTAFIKIWSYECDRIYSDFDDGYTNQCILLQALSDVRNLLLMSLDTKMFIFRRDLKFCSSFNKSKSLLVDQYWCEPADFSALACLLKLSPVLEKLTLNCIQWDINIKWRLN